MKSNQEVVEVITIHFYPEVLEEIFDSNLPEYLLLPINTSQRVFQKIEANAILRSYIDSLLVYFNKAINSFNFNLMVSE
ncbi:MAG: hypothetical protein AAFX57_11335, partial [Bacteroidota bacterium]